MSFFAGTEILPPGIVEARRWISGVAAPPPDHGLYVLCGAGIKQAGHSHGQDAAPGHDK